MCTTGNNQILGSKKIFLFFEDIVKLTLHSLMNFNEWYPKYEFYFKFYCDKIVNGTFVCTHTFNLYRKFMLCWGLHIKQKKEDSVEKYIQSDMWSYFGE